MGFYEKRIKEVASDRSVVSAEKEWRPEGIYGKTPYPRETRPNGPYGSDEDLLRLAGMTMEQAEREAMMAEDESVPDPLTGRIRYRGEPAPEGGPEPSTENR